MDSSAEYVNEVFASRSATAKEMLEANAKGVPYDEQDAYEVLADYPLAIQRKTLVTVILGIGGPGDWIDAVCVKNGRALEIESATYTAQWGSDKKVTLLRPDDHLWKLAEYYIEVMEVNG